MTRPLPDGCWWMVASTEATFHLHHCPIAYVQDLQGRAAGPHGHVAVGVRIVTKRGMVTGSAASLAQGRRFVERYVLAHGLPMSSRVLKGRARLSDPWLASFLARPWQLLQFPPA